MLTRTQAQLAQLSNAERQVGEWILAHPQEALHQDTRTLAAQIGVSQPTLVRFARSLGCTGFDDFRLQLAQDIGSRPPGPPVTLATIAASADLDTLCRSFFDYAIAAMGQVRDRLDRPALAAAVALLDGARQVMFFGYGNAASVAEDARRRFLRLQMLVSAASDPSLQALAAGQLQRGDVLVLVSHTGLAAGLGELVAAVRGRRAGHHHQPVAPGRPGRRHAGPGRARQRRRADARHRATRAAGGDRPAGHRRGKARAEDRSPGLSRWRTDRSTGRDRHGFQAPFGHSARFHAAHRVNDATPW